MNELLSMLSIYHWQDIVEILAFAAGIYAFSCWLAHDKQKNILPYFYSIGIGIGLCHYYNLATLATFFIVYWPGLLMLLVLVHQRLLQKNFVCLKNVHPAKPITENWIEAIIRSSFICASNNKEVVFIIENNDSLQEHMSCPIRLNTTIQGKLLDILLESSAFTSGNGVWINAHGELLGLNTSWNITSHSDSRSMKNNWENHALYYSSLSDVLFCKLSLQSRMFSIIGEGTHIVDTPADTALQVIKQYTRQHFKPLKKDFHYEITQKNTPRSPTP